MEASRAVAFLHARLRGLAGSAHMHHRGKAASTALPFARAIYAPVMAESIQPEPVMRPWNADPLQTANARFASGDDVDGAGDSHGAVGLRSEIASESSRLGDIFLARHGVGRVHIDALRGGSLAGKSLHFAHIAAHQGDRQRVKQLTCGLRAQRRSPRAYRVKNNGVLEFGGSSARSLHAGDGLHVERANIQTSALQMDVMSTTSAGSSLMMGLAPTASTAFAQLSTVT